MIYRLVRELQQKAIPITQACRILQVSRAGYYQHRQRGARGSDRVATVYLKAAFSGSGKSYGSRRLASWLLYIVRLARLLLI